MADTQVKSPWFSNGYFEEGESSGGRCVMDRVFLRKIMHAVGSEPSFWCPLCKERFKIVYGTWAGERLKETTFYCKDCIRDNPNLIKRR